MWRRTASIRAIGGCSKLGRDGLLLAAYVCSFGISPVILGGADRCHASGDVPNGGHHELQQVTPPPVRLRHLGSRQQLPSSLPQAVLCV